MSTWILYGFLIDVIHGVSVGCPGVITFAKALNLDTKQVTMWNQLQTDCCTVSGVMCTLGNGNVTEIRWNNLGLDGVIQPFTLPSTVVHLDLSRNLLRNSLPAASSWPASLSFLEISHNNIVGQFPLTWPAGLKAIYAGSNQMNGTITGLSSVGIEILRVDSNLLTGDLPVFSSSVLDVDLSTNKFTGTLTMNKPTSIVIDGNWIADIVISNITILTACVLSNNALLGNPRVTPLIAKCSINGLFSALVTTYKSTTATSKIVSSTTIGKTVTSTLLKSISTVSSTTIEETNTSTLLKSISSVDSIQTPSQASSLLTETRFGLTSETVETAATTNTMITAISTHYTTDFVFANVSTLTAKSEVPTQLQYLLSPFDFIRIGIHLAINAMFVATVISKAPYKRTVKNAYKKRFSGKDKQLQTLDM